MTRLGELIVSALLAIKGLGETRSSQLLLRLVLLVSGAAAIGVVGLEDKPAPVVLMSVGALLLVATAIAPGSPFGTAAIACIGIAWIVDDDFEGSGDIALTALLGVLLYLVHTTAALCAAMPRTSSVDPLVVTRWYAHVAFVVVVTGVLAAVLAVLTELDGSLTLIVVGLAASLALVAVPVWLYRTADH